MSHNIDDTSWETLFWSLMEAVEQIPHPMADDAWEVFEVAGLQLDADEGDEENE
jgi:hypothetical protein